MRRNGFNFYTTQSEIDDAEFGNNIAKICQPTGDNRLGRLLIMAKDVATFWSLIVNPNEPANVAFSADSYLTISGAALPDLPADGSAAPVRLLADVVTLADSAKSTQTRENVLIAALIPFAREQQRLAIRFSSLNKVTLRVSGTVPVHLCGFLEPVEDGGALSDEEEKVE
jgi:hypothetical protein